MRKAASSYVGQLLHDIAVAHGLVPVDLHGFVQEVAPEGAVDEKANQLRRYGCSADPGESADLSDTWKRFFGYEGCLYGPNRNYRFLEKLEHLDRRRVLILLRDPRDVLTSHYYSRAFSHGPPSNPGRQEIFERHRDEAKEQSIDQFVTKQAEDYLDRYERFIFFLKRFPNCVMLRYESMISDFPTWLRHVFEIWGLPPDPDVLAQFEERADFEVGEENIYAHKRQVLAGDHRRKLKRETVDALTEQFRDVLDFLGYKENGDLVSPQCSSPEKGKEPGWFARLFRS